MAVDPARPSAGLSAMARLSRHDVWPWAEPDPDQQSQYGTEVHGLSAASEPYCGGAEGDGRWLLKAIEDKRPENGDQDRRDAARDEAGHCCPFE